MRMLWQPAACVAAKRHVGNACTPEYTCASAAKVSAAPLHRAVAVPVYDFCTAIETLACVKGAILRFFAFNLT